MLTSDKIHRFLCVSGVDSPASLIWQANRASAPREVHPTYLTSPVRGFFNVYITQFIPLDCYTARSATDIFNPFFSHGLRRELQSCVLGQSISGEKAPRAD
jgi:hypothetical protein